MNASGKSKSVQATLKANVGESSYITQEKPDTGSPLPQLPDDDEGNGGAFNFPFGE